MRRSGKFKLLGRNVILDFGERSEIEEDIET